MSEIVLEVNEREAMGKNANRRLRAGGEVPAVVYGGGRARLRFVYRNARSSRS